MRLLVLIAGVILLFGNPAPAVAEDGASAAIAKIAAQLDHCTAQPDNHNTIAIDGCYSEAVTAADKVVTDTYHAAISRLNHSATKDDLEMQRRLKASQHTWEAYREAECSLQAAYSIGGTEEAAEEAQCQFDKTAERAKSLEQWAKDNVSDN